jgi:hypothetical protein
MAALAAGGGTRLSIGLVIVTLFIVGLANGLTVLVVGFACNPQDAGPPNVREGTAAAAVCRWMDPGWGKAHYYGSKTEWERVFHGRLPNGAYFVPGGFQAVLVDVRRYASAFSPIWLTLIGVVLAKRRRDLRYFASGTLTAGAIIVSLWLIVLYWKT